MDLDPAGYRLLFDSNPLAMFVVDRETMKIVAVNRAACDQYGWSQAEMLELTLRDIRPPEDVPGFEIIFHGLDAEESTYPRSSRHRRKDGRVFEVKLQIARISLAGRRASVVIVNDVTGIADAERRYRALVEHWVEGISVTGADGTLEYISPGGQRLLGYRAEDLVGKPAVATTHPDDNPGAWPGPGETTLHVARVAHGDGRWRWIESATTNLTHDPAVRGYVSNYRDVTARKLAEAAIIASEAKFRALIERIPLATIVHREGEIVYVNPAAAAMLGFGEASAMVGRPLLELVHPEDRELIRQRIAQAEASGGTPDGIGRMLRRDGTTVVVEGRGMRLDFDGQPAIVVVASDVTERHAVFTRMALADRMLSVGTLAAGVAHEINNPLAYISSNLEVLAGDLPHLQIGEGSRLDPATLRELVSDALEGVSRVSTIVGSLRSLARPDRETRGPVDVLAVLATSIKMANNELRHHARLVHEHEANLPLVEAEASRLGQVFLNLLLNAAQAIPEGHAGSNEVRVRAARSEDGRHVRVAIRDTGAGIAPGDLGRIFDPFFTTKAPGSGLGLGLSISHQLVHAMGGEIAVESTVGRGSTFTVILPVASGGAASSGRDRAPEQSGIRVLLVDDEVGIGRAVTLLLAPETEVVAVTRAEDALAKLAGGEDFDVILCDLMMPDITGIELYERIARATPAMAERILFMTGGAFTEPSRAFLDRLGRPHLAKPFSEAQLRRAIERVIAATR